MKNKTFLILFSIVIINSVAYAQDTIRGQVIRVDTVKIEKVRVDTDYLPVQNQAQVQAQVQAQQPPQKAQNSQQKSQGKNDKVYYGGYANFSIDKYSTIGFEHLIAYKLFPKFSVGAKLS